MVLNNLRVQEGPSRMMRKCHVRFLGEEDGVIHASLPDLQDRVIEDSVTHFHRIKIDLGSKTTGISVVQEETGRVTNALEISHRGQQIKDALDSRSSLRRGRRNRKTRYRKPRFLNRTRRDGWLPPSLESRIANMETWLRRIRKLCPITAISQELVRFDLQPIQNPEISGIEYTRGELFGFEVKLDN